LKARCATGKLQDDLPRIVTVAARVQLRSGASERFLSRFFRWRCHAINPPMSKNPSADQYSEQETGGESHAKSGMEAASHWLAPRHAPRLAAVCFRYRCGNSGRRDFIPRRYVAPKPAPRSILTSANVSHESHRRRWSLTAARVRQTARSAGMIGTRAPG